MRIINSTSLAFTGSILSLIWTPSVKCFSFVSQSGALNRKDASRTPYNQNSKHRFLSMNMSDEEVQKTSLENGNTQIKIPASKLRSAQITNVDGEIVSLGEKIGTGTSIVVFLRHMG